MRQRLAIGVAALAALSLPGTALGASLNQQHATLQFVGTMTTNWTYHPQTEIGSGGDCYDSTTFGSGHQQVHYDTRRQHVDVTIVDSGGTIAFQLDPAERARPHHLALGFRSADVGRAGLVETDFEFAPNHSLTCGPPPGPRKIGEEQPPDPEVTDDSGCGGAKFPWDVYPIVEGGTFYPGLAGFIPSDMIKCPIYASPGGDENLTIPREATAHVSVAAVRRALTPRHGKLIIQSSHHFHYSGSKFGPKDVTTTTTVSWKITLIRAHPSR
jgi:hypothetical protein